jgi:hypothetical protein
VRRQIDEKPVRGERVEERVGRGGDRAPCLEHLGERRRAHRRAIREPVLDVLAEHDPLRPMQEAPLLLPGEMADDPADRVHRTKMPRCVFFGHPIEAARPFASREPQLIDERMDHPNGRAHTRVRLAVVQAERQLMEPWRAYV